MVQASRRDQNGELADLVWAVGKGNYESVDGEILPLINDQERLNGYLNPFIALLLNGMKKYDVNNKIAEQSFWATRGKKGTGRFCFSFSSHYIMSTSLLCVLWEMFKAIQTQMLKMNSFPSGLPGERGL